MANGYGDVYEMCGPQAAGVLSAVLVAYGIAMVLYGYRIFKLFLFLLGFGVGFAVSNLTGQTPLFSLAVGVLCGILSFVLWYVGVFLCGAAAGYVLGLAFSLSNSGGAPELAFLFALVGGLLALAIKKFVIIYSTSFSGAGALVQVLSHYISIEQNQQLALVAAIGVGGMVVQYMVTCGGKGGGNKIPEAEERDAPK